MHEEVARPVKRETPSTPGVDPRRPWSLPRIVDRGSLVDVVRSTTGPITDGMPGLMKPTLADPD